MFLIPKYNYMINIQICKLILGIYLKEKYYVEGHSLFISYKILSFYIMKDEFL